jgi:nucleoside-diphosphate-sugar epimerase
VDTIEKVTGKPAHRLENERESGGEARLVADISLAHRMLGYQPQVSLTEGLSQMIRLDPRFQSSD